MLFAIQSKLAGCICINWKPYGSADKSYSRCGAKWYEFPAPENPSRPLQEEPWVQCTLLLIILSDDNNSRIRCDHYPRNSKTPTVILRNGGMMILNMMCREFIV